MTANPADAVREAHISLVRVKASRLAIQHADDLIAIEDGIDALHNRIADLTTELAKAKHDRLAALAGAAPDKPVDWIAQNHHDYWTVQVMCGPGPRFYSIRKSDGQLLELPHKDSPFIPNPFAPHAPAKAREVTDADVSRAYSAWANAKLLDPTDTRARLAIAIEAAVNP